MTPGLRDRLRLAAPQDPRVHQIVSLAVLLAVGVGRLGFDVTVGRALLILATALTTQALLGPLSGRGFDPRSALISGLSLCLLLRTSSPLLAALAAALAIASKFVVRLRGKHLFNPTNIALVALMLATGGVWVSPGQWGNAAFFGFLVSCLGGLVVYRAERSDVTYAFFLFYAASLVARALWLGDPLTIPVHQLQNGALLIFGFFMISDPRTTPDSRPGRILFAFLVALGAHFVQFRLFRTNGLLWSLAACALLVPWIDRLLPGRQHAWRAPEPEPVSKGDDHATPLDLLRPLPPRGALG